MFLAIYISIFAALFFYGILPFIGATYVRSQWRLFRAAVMEASQLPEPGLGRMETGEKYRFIGKVDALEGNDILWARNDRVSVKIDMKNLPVYLLFDSQPEKDVYMERASWKSLGSLSSWGSIFVSATIKREKGNNLVETLPPPLIVFFSGEESLLMERLVYYGRHSDEYWNPVSQVSLAIGVLVMAVLSSASLMSPGPLLGHVLVISLAMIPLMPLLPPGLVFFFLYRNLWRKGRISRAERDLARFKERTRHYQSSKKSAVVWVSISILCLFASISLNIYLLFLFILKIFL